jgi:hypothetical protein
MPIGRQLGMSRRRASTSTRQEQEETIVTSRLRGGDVIYEFDTPRIHIDAHSVSRELWS